MQILKAWYSESYFGTDHAQETLKFFNGYKTLINDISH